MFLINWWAALITIVCIAALYKFVDVRKPDVSIYILEWLFVCIWLKIKNQQQANTTNI